MAVTKEFKPLEMHDRRKKNNPFKNANATAFSSGNHFVRTIAFECMKWKILL